MKALNLIFAKFSSQNMGGFDHDSQSQFPQSPQGMPGTMTCLLCPKVPGGYFQKNWEGVCSTLAETVIFPALF